MAVHGDVVYVLNARDGGSIQGYRSIGPLLAPIPTWHGALGLEPNAAPEFLTTPGQVAFTPEGGKLVVSTKGDTGAIEVFNVNALGGASLHPVVTSLPGAVRFAPTVDSVGNRAVTEACPIAVAIFRVNDDRTLTQVSSIATGEAATCWIVRVGDTLCASNDGSGTLSEVRDAPGEPLALLGTVATDSGTTWRARWRCRETVPQARLAGSGAHHARAIAAIATVGRRGRAARHAVDPDRHPGLRAGGSWRGAARHRQGER